MPKQFMSGVGQVQSDSAALVNSLMERDANGDTNVRDLLASRCLRGAGGLFVGLLNKTGGFVADLLATVYTCNANGAPFTVTLPAAASVPGQEYSFIKTDASANAVTIQGNAAELINGANTTSLAAQYNKVRIICDGTKWHIVG